MNPGAISSPEKTARLDILEATTTFAANHDAVRLDRASLFPHNSLDL
jgi:hypothetical protein